MVREISVTVTAGAGSEKHNHDLDYRQTLEHVHGSAEDVIELIPYKEYKEAINEVLKPFISHYNECQAQRYKSAWDRYNAGIIKTKPRKRDYKPMSYDYYSEHLEDVFFNKKTKQNEKVRMFRSLIVGLGDKEDRLKETITREEAIAIFKEFIEEWNEKYPTLKLLGATVHLDEEGFYHCHIDYKPVSMGPDNSFGKFHVGQEFAFEAMGFEPEQSIINARDKVPIRFNAFRNSVYKSIEEKLSKHKIRLQYGVSKLKEPDKDSSKNQQIEVWQEARDSVRTLQHEKNIVLETVDKDFTDPENIEKALTSFQKIEQVFTKILSSPHHRLDSKSRVVSFHLLDQMKSFWDDFRKFWSAVLNENEILRYNYQVSSDSRDFYKKQAEERVPKEKYEELEKENQKLKAVMKAEGKSDRELEYIKKYPGIPPEYAKKANEQIEKKVDPGDR